MWDVTGAYKISVDTELFLLTHPVWDVTIFLASVSSLSISISTHTSRVGCDPVPRPISLA